MRSVTVCCGFVLSLLALGSAAVAQLQPGGAAGINTPPPAGAAVSPPQVLPEAATAGRSRLRRENPVVSIQEMVRLESQSASQLRGIGIVTGLRATGDSGGELVMARPLAQ